LELGTTEVVGKEIVGGVDETAALPAGSRLACWGLAGFVWGFGGTVSGRLAGISARVGDRLSTSTLTPYTACGGGNFVCEAGDIICVCPWGFAVNRSPNWMRDSPN
jgi:hypothetical protein